MNLEEAREIIKRGPNPNLYSEWREAMSYLEALQCKEVIDLVKALRFCHEAFEKVEDNELMGKYILNSHGFIVKDALLQWEKAAGKE